MALNLSLITHFFVRIKKNQESSYLYVSLNICRTSYNTFYNWFIFNWFSSVTRLPFLEFQSFQGDCILSFFYTLMPDIRFNCSPWLLAILSRGRTSSNGLSDLYWTIIYCIIYKNSVVILYTYAIMFSLSVKQWNKHT